MEAKKIGMQLDAEYDADIKVRRDAKGKITAGVIVGDVTHQNQAVILCARKGEIKEFPTVGVGLGDACVDDDFGLWRREVAEQIERDGQRIETLIFNEREFILKAKYIN